MDGKTIILDLRLKEGFYEYISSLVDATKNIPVEDEDHNGCVPFEVTSYNGYRVVGDLQLVKLKKCQRRIKNRGLKNVGAAVVGLLETIDDEKVIHLKKAWIKVFPVSPQKCSEADGEKIETPNEDDKIVANA